MWRSINSRRAMIEHITKDLTTVGRGVIAQGVNCRGVMGSGVALALRTKFPEIFPPYKELCNEYSNNRLSLLGCVQLVDVSDLSRNETLIVANCFTQLNYGRGNVVYADIDAVKHSLVRLIAEAIDRELPLYIPRIGCKRGGLNWDTQVGPTLEQLDRKDVEVFVCDL